MPLRAADLTQAETFSSNAPPTDSSDRCLPARSLRTSGTSRCHGGYVLRFAMFGVDMLCCVGCWLERLD